MPKKLPKPTTLHRDGTSQAARTLRALDPEYVSVEERSTKELLVFARKLAEELKYVNASNRRDGDWSGFFQSVDLDQAVAFMDDPSKFNSKETPGLFRPHFILLLTFLKLLSYAQEGMNTITRRHLEYYYRDVLGMVRKPTVADKVNILLRPARKFPQVEVPAGTLFNAGPDSSGVDRLYQTDRPVLINHAEISRISSVFVEKKTTGIREASEEGFIRMLEIALGDPLPGDPLPLYAKNQPISKNFLNTLASLVAFCGSHLYMALFDLRQLIRFKRQRDRAQEEWIQINALLEIAGKRKHGDPNYEIRPENPRDFDTNFEHAIGVKPRGAAFFDEIEEVDDIYDLLSKWRRSYDKDRIELATIVRNNLYFEDFDNFKAMVEIKLKIDNEWREINRILSLAARKKDPISTLIIEAPTDFETNLMNAVNPDYSSLSGVSHIDEYYDAVVAIENYFFMSAERFAYILAVENNPSSAAKEWGKVTNILEKAHTDKVYRTRRDRLAQIRQADGLGAMIVHALGDDFDPSEDAPPLIDQLGAYQVDAKDLVFLKRIKEAETGTEPTSEDWTRVYRIVEIAQRIRQKLPEPVAAQEQWLNLHPWQEAAAADVTLGITADKDNPRWRTFAYPHPAPEPNHPPPSPLGWAISSSLLCLNEGKRTLYLTIAFEKNGFDSEKIGSCFSLAENALTELEKESNPFRIEITGEKGWIEPNIVKAGYRLPENGADPDSTKTYPRLEFELVFNEDADPISPLMPDQSAIQSQWPVLRFMLRQIWDKENKRFIVHYTPFKPLRLLHAHLSIKAVGLSSLHIQNDDSLLKAQKPFEPFGTQPGVGSRFFFGHSEIVSKPLDSLTCKIQWMNAPSDMIGHYQNYGIDTGSNTSEKNSIFSVNASLVADRKEYGLKSNEGGSVKTTLFDNTDANLVHEVSWDMSSAEQPATAWDTVDEVKQWRRYFQWELNAPDFQHTIYPALAAQKAVEMAAAVSNQMAAAVKGETTSPVVASNYTVNPPYTPTINRLSLDYTASVVLDADTMSESSETVQLFHIHPIGFTPVQTEDNKNGCPFIPQYDNEGELYIGIGQSQPPQHLSILFQLAEGSADPDLEPAKVQWSYLDHNRWKTLHEGDILIDSTRGLINSGIIEFKLNPTEQSTRLPGNLFWLRAAVARDSRSVCDTITIRAQAVSATFIDNGNASDHYHSPLATGSITKTTSPMPRIAEIQQPFTSYGGSKEEGAGSFYTRVSERIRHKNRALTTWDYERLVLENFPPIHKAKCLPAAVSERSDQIGKVEVIVIPDIRNKLPFDPFEPKAPADLIADIESYLNERCPAWAEIKVRNAHYVAVKIRVGVRFRTGYDEGYHKQRLIDELNRFLSPWAYEEGSDIVIGGKIYANHIVSFIDQRDYVDYVAHIHLFSSDDGRKFKPVPIPNSDGYHVTTDRPDGVLVGFSHHDIDIISEHGYDDEQFTGINYMKIELDFIVGG